MKSKKDILLVLASMCFLIILGAAVYEHVVLIPKWGAAPPASLTMFQGIFALHAEHFWIPIHPVTLLMMGTALYLNWNNSRRKIILIVLGFYILVLVVTFSYFVPELLSIIKTPFRDTMDDHLVQRATRWEALSLIRVGFLAILSFMLLSALTKSNETDMPHTSQSAPLTYENDALGG